MSRLVLTAVLVAMMCCPSAAWSQKKKKSADVKDIPPAEAFAKLLPEMSAADASARFTPQQKWQAICFRAGAPGNEAMRLEVCRLMTDALTPTTADPARVWMLKQLEFLARGESLDAIASAVGDKNPLVHDAAVRALANNPAKEATAKLVEKLTAAKDSEKIGLINALGFRGDDSAASALARELNGAAAQPAARALARMPGPKTASLLAAARTNAKEPTRTWICDAYLACADRLLKDGKAAEALAIYTSLHETEKSTPIRIAALQGLLKAQGDDAGPTLLKLLSGNDTHSRSIALAQITFARPKALQTLAAGIDRLPNEAQVFLVGALAARGDKSQRDLARKAALSNDDRLQMAGILALGKLGDVSTVPLLIESALGNGKSKNAARDSLTRVTGDGIDEAILAAFRAEKDSGKRISLIQVLDGRRAAIATPTLIEVAQGVDPAARAAAMTALKKLAEPKDVPALVPALLKTAKGKERSDAEATLIAILTRIPEADKRADVLVPLLTDDTRPALLPVVGGLGGPNALAVVRKSLAGDSRPAALQALVNWPDATVSEDLLTIAKTSADAAEKTTALRGVIRINSLSNEHPAAPRLANLKQALPLAGPADTKLILVALGTVKDIEAFRLALPYLDNKDTEQAACRAIVELAHSKTLREPNIREFHPTLDRIIKICRDKGLVERAKKYRAGG